MFKIHNTTNRRSIDTKIQWSTFCTQHTTVDVISKATFLSLDLETSRLKADWLLIMFFRARFWSGSWCILENLDMASESDEVAFLLVAIDDDGWSDNEEKERFSVKAKIFLFSRSRNFRRRYSPSLILLQLLKLFLSTEPIESWRVFCRSTNKNCLSSFTVIIIEVSRWTISNSFFNFYSQFCSFFNAFEHFFLFSSFCHFLKIFLILLMMCFLNWIGILVFSHKFLTSHAAKVADQRMVICSLCV